jgi:ribulose-phosphate 3-epimerase
VFFLARVSISVLSADFSCLKEEIKKVEDAKPDFIHLDVMDNVFVPNISFGFPVINAIKKISSLPLDAHLMTINPEKYVERLAETGVKNITFHVEAVEEPSELIDLIKSKKITAGICVNAKTPVEKVFSFLQEVDLVLVMSVNAGFGGQKFLPEALEKVKALHEKKKKLNLEFEIQIDGGIDRLTAPKAVDAGVENLVCGSAFFKDSNPRKLVSFFKSLKTP